MPGDRCLVFLPGFACPPQRLPVVPRPGRPAGGAGRRARRGLARGAGDRPLHARRRGRAHRRDWSTGSGPTAWQVWLGGHSRGGLVAWHATPMARASGPRPRRPRLGRRPAVAPARATTGDRARGAGHRHRLRARRSVRARRPQPRDLRRGPARGHPRRGRRLRPRRHPRRCRGPRSAGSPAATRPTTEAAARSCPRRRARRPRRRRRPGLTAAPRRSGRRDDGGGPGRTHRLTIYRVPPYGICHRHEEGTDDDDHAPPPPGRRPRPRGRAQHGRPATGRRHEGHDTHAGHDPEMFRRRFWVSLLLTLPLVVTSEMVMDWFGYSLDLPGTEVWVPVLGSVVFVWGGWPFLVGRPPRGPRPPAGDDAADLDGDHRRLQRLDGHQPRVVRPRLLVGAGRPRHDHAPRPLAGDEGDRPGPGRPGGPRRADPRRGRADRAPTARSSPSPVGDLGRRRAWCWCGPADGCRPTARSSTAPPSSTSR